MAVNIGNDRPLYLRRSPHVIWRLNDDGSILLLDELSGEAFLLSENVARIWIALVESPDEQLVDWELPAHLSECLNLLQSKGLIESVNCAEPTYMSSRTLLKLIDKTSTFSSSEDCFVSRIEFGACDCSQGGRGWKRNMYCRDINISKHNASIVIA